MKLHESIARLSALVKIAAPTVALPLMKVTFLIVTDTPSAIFNILYTLSASIVAPLPSIVMSLVISTPSG